MPNFPVGDPVQMLNSGNDPVIRMLAGTQSGGVIVPTGFKGAHLWMSDNDNSERILLNGSECELSMRAKKKPGQVRGDLVMVLDGTTGNLLLGGGNTEGDVVLFPVGADNRNAGEATIHLDAGKSVILMRSGGQETIRIDGTEGHIRCPVISIRSGEQETIRIDGAKGDIILANADGAEEFEVEGDIPEPGSVLVIEDDTRLRLADRPYDQGVAGIVSGASGIRPGIVLGRGREGVRVPVALFGRVNCKIDASYGPVLAGDLLTTSETPGHAMRAEPDNRALGAVIGKALRALNSGRDLVPVLVALQ